MDSLTAIGLPGETQEALLSLAEWKVMRKVCVFGVDFETCLRGYFPDYVRLEDEARKAGVTAKPHLARWVAERLPINDDEGWKKIRILATAFRLMLGLIEPGEIETEPR